jgi:type IV pilus assembly protein PilV
VLVKGLSQQKGLTLVEIMVALLVLAVGLAGMAALTLFNVTGTASAQTYSQATVFADQMADSIRANAPLSSWPSTM